MNKNLIFSPKAQYVTPSFKSVVLDAKATMMNVTSPGGYNTNGLVDLNGDNGGVEDQSEGWGF